MKIGLLGGSFNPAHQGHIHISNLAVQKLGLNQVWWIPTAQNPLKEKTITPFAARFASCLEITKNHPKIRIKNFEKDSFFTYDLVRRIKKLYPQAQFYWIAGADILPQFHRWKNYKKLLKIIKFVIFSRNCKDKPRFIPTEFLIFKTKNYDISSSEIRNNSR